MTSIIFMGTPQFAVPILHALVEADYDLLAVVTQPDKPVGRKHTLHQSPVKVAATALGIPVFQPAKLSGSPELDQLIALAPDLIVTAAYGQFLPTKFLNAAKVTAVNVHGSLLPKYRGGAPIQYAIINGDAETGVTIIQMVKQMDAGGMYAQAALSLTRADDTGTAFDRLSLLGRDLLLQTLPHIIDGTATLTPQDPDQVTFAPNITKDQEHLDLTLPATQVDQWVRGLRPHVGGWVRLNGQRVKLWDVTPLADTTTQAPGTVVALGKKRLVLAAGKGTTLQINTLQPAGKARQPISAYMNGTGRQLEVGAQVITNGEE
ncbi:methionyl-tRNA formyltransferase [Lacticaseibacillus thailandensis]|uniref:Methionyl-tRNA formyltransferase n=1 Tax=Lacticaseibacillus thailandensis DSM 22698 = JCM 13996 TaxID=1423810 RepID=A0A0R2CIA6_9LACO|nr:methionyl-tRNA formyltransferase [Lacticaseibacillus thailandensis]KRM88249.1 methionyl-trna formyltransferase [Lacticaseibacillus thailandensis DSM 22698 = JCM 13996]